MADINIFLLVLRVAILLAVLLTLTMDAVILHDIDTFLAQLPQAPTAVSQNITDGFTPSVTSNYLSMLLLPDLAGLILFGSLFWYRHPRPVERACPLACRVLSSILLAALSIYKPMIYMFRLQNEMDRYWRHHGKEVSFAQTFGCQERYSHLGEEDEEHNGISFCTVFRVRLAMAFGWGFLVLGEMAIAYAGGEFTGGVGMDRWHEHEYEYEENEDEEWEIDEIQHRCYDLQASPSHHQTEY